MITSPTAGCLEQRLDPSTAANSAGPNRRGSWLLLLGVLGGLWLWLAWCLWPQWSFYESYQFGWFVPFLTAALFWKRWQVAPEPQKPGSTPIPLAAIAIGAALLFPSRLVHEANSLWRTISWPLGLGVTAITLSFIYCLGGRAWLKHFAFPALFILVALPWPGEIERRVILPLTELNTRATVESLFVCGFPALQSGNVISIASGQVGVDEACSGIRSLHSTLMVAFLVGELYLLRVASRLWVVVGGVLLAFIFNVGRTFTLSWLCASKGMAALDKWHDPLGTGVAVACMGGVWLLAGFFRKGPITAGLPGEQSEPGALTWSPWPVSKAVCLGLGAWLLITEAGTRAWFHTRESKMTKATEWSLKVSETKDAFEKKEISKAVQRSFLADEAIAGGWSEPDDSRWQIYYFRWHHGSKTAQIAKGHWPEVCLANSGKVLRTVDTKLFQVHDLSLPFRAYAFEDQGMPLYVFHCVWEERSSSASAIDLGLKRNFLSRVQAAWEGKRNLGQQLLEVAVWGYNDLQSAEAAFLRQLESMITVQNGSSASRAAQNNPAQAGNPAQS